MFGAASRKEGFSAEPEKCPSIQSLMAGKRGIWESREWTIGAGNECS